MKKLPIRDVPHAPHPHGVTSSRRLLGEAFDTDALAVTYYEIDGGGQFAGSYHRHLNREEVFIILSGTASFETENGTITVQESEAIYFEPGDWQLGYNSGDGPTSALLVATPKELFPVEAYLNCPTCDEETRFIVNPRVQKNGETMIEKRVCRRCGDRFEQKS